MTTPNEEIPVEAQKALIERMRASSAFKGARALTGLLLYLFENRERPLAGKEIDSEFFKLPDFKVSGLNARQRIMDLKKSMEKYRSESPDEPLKCVLPDAGNTGGYQIRFERISSVSACRRFWHSHLHSEKEVPIVCSRLLFYWDDESGMMFRFMDANIEGLGKQEALDALKDRHRIHYKEGLIPGHVYIDVGSMTAAEVIREYFRVSDRHVPIVFDKFSNPEWQKSSPIIIGNIRNTPSVKKMFGSSDAASLAYRLDEDRYSGISIVNPRNNEIEALKAAGIELDDDGRFCEPFTKLTIGIVMRIPNPRGNGVITLLSADGTFTTEQLAVALTDEAQLRAIFIKMGWRIDEPVPDRFELMFKAKLWPGGFDDQATDAEFICGRA